MAGDCLSDYIVVNYRDRDKDDCLHFLTHIEPCCRKLEEFISPTAKRVYTSKFNAWYVRTHLNGPDGVYVGLELGKTYKIDYDGRTILVACFDSNYVTGSIMILYQDSGGVHLYTGNCSYTQDLLKSPIMKSIIERKALTTLQLDSLYLDQVSEFPTVSDVTEILISHLRKSKPRVTNLYVSEWGLEMVLVKVAKALNETIIINEKYLPMINALEADKFFSSVNDDGRIFAIYENNVDRKLTPEEDFIFLRRETGFFKRFKCHQVKNHCQTFVFYCHNNNRQCHEMMKKLSPDVIGIVNSSVTYKGRKSVDKKIHNVTVHEQKEKLKERKIVSKINKTVLTKSFHEQPGFVNSTNSETSQISLKNNFNKFPTEMKRRNSDDGVPSCSQSSLKKRFSTEEYRNMNDNRVDTLKPIKMLSMKSETTKQTVNDHCNLKVRKVDDINKLLNESGEINLGSTMKVQLSENNKTNQISRVNYFINPSFNRNLPTQVNQNGIVVKSVNSILKKNSDSKAPNVAADETITLHVPEKFKKKTAIIQKPVKSKVPSNLSSSNIQNSTVEQTASEKEGTSTSSETKKGKEIHLLVSDITGTKIYTPDKPGIFLKVPVFQNRPEDREKIPISGNIADLHKDYRSKTRPNILRQNPKIENTQKVKPNLTILKGSSENGESNKIENEEMIRRVKHLVNNEQQNNVFPTSLNNNANPLQKDPISVKNVVGMKAGIHVRPPNIPKGKIILKTPKGEEVLNSLDDLLKRKGQSKSDPAITLNLMKNNTSNKTTKRHSNDPPSMKEAKICIKENNPTPEVKTLLHGKSSSVLETLPVLPKNNEKELKIPHILKRGRKPKKKTFNYNLNSYDVAECISEKKELENEAFSKSSVKEDLDFILKDVLNHKGDIDLTPSSQNQNEIHNKSFEIKRKNMENDNLLGLKKCFVVLDRNLESSGFICGPNGSWVYRLNN